MRRAIVLVTLVTLAGCAAMGLRPLRLGGVRRYHAEPGAAIERSAVRILDQAPAGAVHVASIWGVRGNANHTAEKDGQEIAARMGCDVLVITGRGYEMRDNGVSVGEFPTIEFDAYRTAQ